MKKVINDKLISDSGWIDATLTSNFEKYNSNSIVQYRKRGKVVSIQGAVKPTKEIAAGSSTVIFNLPTGYIPTSEQVTICQGSGMNKWELIVGTNGKVNATRYGTTTNIAIPTTAWLPFNITYMVN